MNRIAIVIVTYNRLELLKECINCALNQNEVEVELIIINNNSTDGTKQYLDSINISNIHIYNEKNNIGGAGGFHDGVKYSIEHTKCDWILLIDDDAMLRPNYLSMIIKEFDSNCSAYAGSVYVDEKVDIRHRSRFNGGSVGLEEYNNASFDCDVATFCGLLISRKIVEKIGYPIKEFFIWNDDTEYSYRFSAYTKVKVVTKAILDHKTENPTYKVGSVRDDWKLYYGFRNTLVIYKKYKKKKKYITKLIRLYGKACLLRLKAIFNKQNANDYRYNATLRLDAIKDARNNNMNKNSKY